MYKRQVTYVNVLFYEKRFQKRRKRLPSIKEVARLAGVSITTVSRVINNKGSVKKETAEKVWEAVHLLNYQPNQMCIRDRKDGGLLW